MMNNAAFLVSEILLAILWGYSLYAVMNPKKIVEFTLDRSKRSMKFYGFIATIKPTKKTTKILLKGHLIVLFLLTIYLIVVPLLFR
jgi:hypothetical protein